MSLCKFTKRIIDYIYQVQHIKLFANRKLSNLKTILTIHFLPEFMINSFCDLVVRKFLFYCQYSLSCSIFQSEINPAFQVFSVAFICELYKIAQRIFLIYVYTVFALVEKNDSLFKNLFNISMHLLNTFQRSFPINQSVKN